MLFCSSKKLKAIYAVVFVAILGVATLNPISTVYGDQQKNMSFTVTANSVLSINIDSSAASFSMNLNPDTGNLYTGSISINVGTNNPLGYSLYMKMSASSLVNSSVSPTAYIDSITSDTTSSNFPTNKWGYSMDNGANFKVIPTTGSGNIISSSNAPIASTTVNVTFGSKIDENTVAGAYTGSANFQIVANTVGE